MFIWATSEPERLGNYREVIEDPTEEVALSVASAWEIVIKHGAGKVSLPEQPSSSVTSRIAMLGLRATTSPLIWHSLGRHFRFTTVTPSTGCSSRLRGNWTCHFSPSIVEWRSTT